jgi:hypothetical protein
VLIGGVLAFWGDPNCDGIVDARDALLVLVFASGAQLPAAPPQCHQVNDSVQLSN